MLQQTTRFDSYQISQVLEEGDTRGILKELGETDKRQKIERNLLVLGASAAINRTLEEEASKRGKNIDYVDDRATAVLAHAINSRGIEAIGEMPGGSGGIHDIDKHLQTENGSNNDLRGIWDAAFSAERTEFRQSLNNGNLDGRKYNAELKDPFKGEDIPLDLLYAETSVEFEQIESLEVLNGVEIRAPSLEEMIVTKGSIDTDNGYGYDCFREKDGEELLALLSFAEDRGITANDIQGYASRDQLSVIGTRVEENYPTIHTAEEEKDSYIPSREYAGKIISWKDYQ